MGTSRRQPWPGVVLVQGHSMEPTLRPGTVLVTVPVRVGRGDIVVFRHASGARYVKRVAGVGGDRVELEAGRLRVNGRSLDGRARIAGAVVARWTVPNGHLFLVGDNLGFSDDSRTWDQPFVPSREAQRAFRLIPPRLGALPRCWSGRLRFGFHTVLDAARVEPRQRPPVP